MRLFSTSQDEVLRSRNEASERALLREKETERTLLEAQEVLIMTAARSYFGYRCLLSPCSDDRFQ